MILQVLALLLDIHFHMTEGRDIDLFFLTYRWGSLGFWRSKVIKQKNSLQPILALPLSLSLSLSPTMAEQIPFFLTPSILFFTVASVSPEESNIISSSNTNVFLQ